MIATSPLAFPRLRRPLLVLGLLGSGLVATGCNPPPPADTDAGFDGGGMLDVLSPRPDGSRSCTEDAECDDHVACTIDQCTPGGYCESRSDPSTCDDAVFCNGLEICHPIRGCIAGPRESCDDSDVCTIDRCNEGERRCDHTPRDLDADGDVDFFCPGGGDCDDLDGSRSSIVREICDDMIDNDCDDMADEAGCGRAPYDVCAPLSPADGEPLDVSAGGTFLLSTLGAADDYGVSCGRGPDLVTTFTIPAGSGPRDLEVTAQGGFGVSVSLRTTCDDATSQLECQRYYPTRLRRRSLPEGTYFLILAADPSGGPITLDVDLSPPTALPSNESCTAPVDLPAGVGTIMGSFVDATDDLFGVGCSSGGLDLVYHFTVPSDGPHDVRIAATGARSENLSFAVRSACDDASTEIQCANGSPARARLHELAPGDYFVIVEGSTWDEAEFSLAVEILAPTPRLPGDTCADAIPLELGTPYDGVLDGREHDYDTSCGYYYPEAVHELVLTDDADVAIEVEGSSFLAVSLSAAPCGTGAERVCRQGSDARMRIHDLAAGTYYLVVESPNLASYTITATAVSPPVVATPVSGNDLCGSAVVVPETGGYYTGTTVGYISDLINPATCPFTIPATGNDVAFRLELTEPRHVIASLEGTVYSSLLLVYRNNCPASGGGDLYCSYDYPFPTIERTMDPGIYYFVIDGYAAGSQGTNFIEFLISDP